MNKLNIEHLTSNIQHRTPNIEGAAKTRSRTSKFDMCGFMDWWMMPSRIDGWLDKWISGQPSSHPPIQSSNHPIIQPSKNSLIQ
jgi:hypothetical protein